MSVAVAVAVAVAVRFDAADRCATAACLISGTTSTSGTSCCPRLWCKCPNTPPLTPDCGCAGTSELHAVIQRQAVTINHLNAKVDVLLSTLGCSPPPRPRPSGFGSGFVGGAGFGSRLSNVGPAGYSFRSQFK